MSLEVAETLKDILKEKKKKAVRSELRYGEEES